MSVGRLLEKKKDTKGAADLYRQAAEDGVLQNRYQHPAELIQDLTANAFHEVTALFFFTRTALP